VSPLLNWSTLERIYPRYPHINDIHILERVSRLDEYHYTVPILYIHTRLPIRQGVMEVQA
jgi:hypothetical protein